MGFIEGIDDTDLIEELLFCLRQKRVTEERSHRLIVKRQDWRRKNNYPVDELLEEVYAEQLDSITLEKVSFHKLLSNCKKKQGRIDLKNRWFGPVMQPYEP